MSAVVAARDPYRYAACSIGQGAVQFYTSERAIYLRHGH